jgi:hypothetical protein
MGKDSPWSPPIAASAVGQARALDRTTPSRLEQADRSALETSISLVQHIIR